MKYRLEVDIHAPRTRVVELFDNPDNMPKWQTGLVSFEHMSGVPGQPGAKSRLKYKMGKREIEMIETVTERNLPETFSGTYEADGMWNSVANRFSEQSPGTTHWILDTEFKATSTMLKVMLLLLPGMFKKQSLQFMQQFKGFVEGEQRNQRA